MKFTGKKTRQLIRIGLLHKYLTPFDLYLFSVQQYLHSPAHGSLHWAVTRIKSTKGKATCCSSIFRAALATSRGGKSTASRLESMRNPVYESASSLVFQ